MNIDKNVSIHPYSTIGYRENGGSITIKKGSRIEKGVILRSCTGDIYIDENVVININSILFGMGDITIGKNSLISPNVQMYAQSHGIKRNELIRKQPNIPMPIIIEEDVWIGAGAIILGNVTIQKGAIVGAGSVVTTNTLVKQYEIWAGNPAKKIGER